MNAIKFFMTLILVSSMVFAAEAAKVHLKIIPPDDDGGVQLLSYIVERRQVGESRWIVVKELPAVMVEQGGRFVYAEIGCTVDNLIEGRTYIFRVITENLNGQGPAGEETLLIKIDKEDIDITVRSGPGYASRRSMSFSVFSDAPFAKQALEREMAYRKEESLANLLNKSV